MKTYAIIDTPEKWPEGVLQTPASARYNADRTKVVVKWTTDEAPDDLKDAAPLFHAKDVARRPAGARDILDELAGPEWSPPDPDKGEPMIDTSSLLDVDLDDDAALDVARRA